MLTVNKNSKNGNSLARTGKEGLYQLKSYLKLWCLMPYIISCHIYRAGGING